VLLRLAGPGRVRLAEIDTSHFVGNSPGAATLTGFSTSGDRVELLPRTDLLPDTRHRFLVEVDDVVEQARLDIYPDGGLSRLRLFGELA
jgi:allantoicase